MGGNCVLETLSLSVCFGRDALCFESRRSGSDVQPLLGHYHMVVSTFHPNGMVLLRTIPWELHVSYLGMDMPAGGVPVP